ncbi:MFS transporter [Paenibacillus solisilvae]|uniref:MFS transporter n=1 Tax=Paenibacillus solisilvae TaxID=2486751 RepID=A0ABW0VX74_9BACL
MLSPEFYRKFGIYGGGFFYTITGMAQPFFTLYAQEVGASNASIGFLVTMRALLPIFIAMPIGQLIDSVGPVRMLKYGSVSLSLSLFTNMIATSLWMMAISQIFMGICVLIMSSCFQVLVSEGRKKERNGSINKYSMWMSAGGMLGPLIGGGITSLFANKLFGYKFTFGAAGVTSVLFIILLLIISKGYQHAEAEKSVKPKDLLNTKGILDSYISGWHLLKIRSVQFGLIATFLIMYIQSLYVSFMPIYLDELGYSTLLISVIISIRGFASMLSRYGLGWFMRLASMERILIIAGIIASIGVVLTPLAGLHMAWIIIVVMIIGGAVGINQPVSIMIMVDDDQGPNRGKLMGMRLIMNRISQILSPAIFGILGQTLGLSIAFYAGGGFLVAAMFGFSLFTSLKWKLKTPGAEPTEGDQKKPFSKPQSKSNERAL